MQKTIKNKIKIKLITLIEQIIEAEVVREALHYMQKYCQHLIQSLHIYKTSRLLNRSCLNC